jgi:phthalate 4,5-dioxygenase oxygenase subunit
MLSHEENQLLCRVEGGAPAGETMRRYWLPALLSEEAETDGAPIRLRLVGQNLVAFRDTSGKLGIVDAACPHRLASLALGRNEEGGLRCIYHGWKFDVAGRCVEMPTEPAGYNFADRVRIGSYPVHETGGIAWTYLGAPEHQPEFPAMDWTQLPRERLCLIKFVQNSNYMQALEGGVDTAHTWFLHRGDIPDWQHRLSLTLDFSPRLETEDTTYGFRYASIRRPSEDPEKKRYIRVTNVVYPTTVLVPRPLNDALKPAVQMFIPIDDDHTLHFTVFFSPDGKPIDERAIREDFRCVPGVHIDEKTFALDTQESNWWKQDRAAMKAGSYTGISGIPRQDVACQESMGSLVDRSREHLGTSDVAIIRMRRRYLQNIRDVMSGKPAIGTEAGIDYPHLRSEQRLIDVAAPWQSVGAFAGEYTMLTSGG